MIFFLESGGPCSKLVRTCKVVPSSTQLSIAGPGTIFSAAGVVQMLHDCTLEVTV